MAKTLMDLAKRMYAIAAEIPAANSKLAVKVALTVVGDLSYKTPVDTSKALSNWVVTLGGPNVGIIPPNFPGIKGSSQGASAAEALAKAKAILANKKPGQSIFITNNLPYIRRLNDGYSRQAPAGFVERAVLIGRKQVEKAKVLENG